MLKFYFFNQTLCCDHHFQDDSNEWLQHKVWQSILINISLSTVLKDILLILYSFSPLKADIMLVKSEKDAHTILPKWLLRLSLSSKYYILQE